MLLVLESPDAPSSAEDALGGLSPSARGELFACAPSDITLDDEHRIVADARRIELGSRSVGPAEALALEEGDLVIAPAPPSRRRERVREKLEALLKILRARGVKVYEERSER